MLLFFLLLIVFIIISLLTLRIEFEIKDFTASNYIKIHKNNFNIIFKFYIFNYLKIVQIKLNKEKIKKIVTEKKLEQIDLKKITSKLPKNKKEDIKLLQLLKIKKLNLKLEIGTIDIILTTFLIPIISTIISNILTKSAINRNCYYKITPLYTNENTYNINLNCIISVKLIHIINIMFKYKNGDDKNDRASYRRTYAYSNE